VKTGPFGSQLHESDYSESGIPVVMPQDIVDGKIEQAHIARVSETHVERLRKHKLSKGDIIYGRRGDIGRQALIREENIGWLCGTGCLRITLGNSSVIPGFLHRYLQMPEIISWIEGQAIGATMPNLNTNILRRVPVTFPKNKETQHKIAAILSTYDDLIENSNRRIALLEHIAEEIYREWFVRLRFPGHKKAKTVKGLPLGWEQRKISDFARCKYGHTESAVLNDKLPKFLRVMDINKASFISWSEVPNCPISDIELQKHKLVRDDVVIARMADPGKVAIVEQDLPSVFASYLIKIDYDRAQVTPYYLFYTLRADAYLSYFSGANSGATRGSINGTLIGSTKTIVPNRELLDKFEAIVRPIRAQLNNHVRKVELLRQTRDRLLPRLISGKLSVENLDIQFPPGMTEELNVEPTVTAHA